MGLKKNTAVLAALLTVVFCISLYSNKTFTDQFFIPKNFYFAFSLLPLIIWVVWSILRESKLHFKVNVIDCSVVAYYIYIAMWRLMDGQFLVYNSEFINHSLLMVFYFIIRREYSFHSGFGYLEPTLHENSGKIKKEKTTKRSKQNSIKKPGMGSLNHFQQIIISLTILLFVNLIYGLYQHMSHSEQVQKAFIITGSFGNPGPFSNYLVILFPFLFPIITHRNHFPKFAFFLALASLVMMLILLPLTQARTSWIGLAFAISAFVLFKALKNKNVLHFFSKKLVRSAALGLLIIAMVSISIFLFNYKNESSLGRLFIWEICLDIIKDKPLLGHGHDSFQLVKNDFQGYYFESNPTDTQKAYLADNATYAFNEFLQITSELGLLGFVLFSLILFFAFRTQIQINNPFLKSIVVSVKILLGTLILASLISYPLKILPIQILFYFALGIIASLGNPKTFIEFNVPRNISIAISIFLTIGMVFFYQDQFKKYHAEKEWTETYHLMRKGQTDLAYQNYSELYPAMKYNKYFLFNYGAELMIMGKYDQSVNVLNETLKVFNNVEVYVYLATAYEQVGNFEMAEHFYKIASSIIPSRFFPKYGLAKLYVRMGKIDKAKIIAREIIEMPVKVKSELAMSIHNEMRELLDNF